MTIRNLKWSKLPKGFLMPSLHLEARQFPPSSTINFSSSYHYQQMINILDEHFRREILEEIRKHELFSIMIDAGTDCTGNKIFSVMVRFWVDSALKTIHVGLQDLKGNSTGRGQYEALCSILTNFGLSLNNCVCICTDGDSSPARNQARF
ncbi:hypothetical protein BLNAU_12481 [Blattamonas nauphoetae]|uniref:DUF4371 domain-containing protein n=1 Tax=Blattamonas nauphoetae TaxID=2049346 RepID=A0ABQ9XKH7_9EUKA|nr:hypothetical protein BLNAU_12481 [Blattamonas nauphoetae]